MNLNKLKTAAQYWARLSIVYSHAIPNTFVFNMRSLSDFLPKEYRLRNQWRGVPSSRATKFSKSTDAKAQQNLCAPRGQTYHSVELSKTEATSSMESVFQRFYEEVEFRSQLTKKLEKIEVRHKGHDKNLSVRVNRNYSTPLDVARHLGQNYVRLSAAAMLSNGRLLDMNQPIWLAHLIIICGTTFSHRVPFLTSTLQLHDFAKIARF